MDHVSYITPDNVCYIGDALMCGRTLHASRLPYAFNFRQSLETIEKLRDSLADCEALAVAHCGVLYDHFDDLVDENLRITEEQAQRGQGAGGSPHVLRRGVRRRVRPHGRQRVHPKKAQSLERFLRPYLEFMVDEGSHRMVMRGTTLCYEPLD